MIEYQIYELVRDAEGVYVLGRCLDTAFGVGDTFTQFWWTHVELDDATKQYVTLDEGSRGELTLRVREIGYYGGTIGRLDPCHTAGIRFTGSGMELLERIDFEAERFAHRSWSLRGAGGAPEGVTE